MFSKKTQFMPVAMALLAVSFIATGCSVFNKPEKKDQNVSLSTGGPECLSQFPDKTLSYFEGTTESEAEVDQNWNCLTNSLNFFLGHTRGKFPNTYQSYELQNFVNTYFTKEHKISNALMRELMEVKVALFGGETSALSRDEVLRVIELFNLLKKHSLLLRRFMPITADHAKVLGAITTGVLSNGIREAADETGRFFESVGNSYSFEHGTALLKELEFFFYPDENKRDNQNVLAWLSQRMELVQGLKGILISSDTTHINKNEWGGLLRVAARVQGLLLQVASESVSHSGWLTESGLDALDRILPQALEVFKETREARRSSLVDNGTISAKDTPNKVRGPAIENLVRTLQKMRKSPDVYSTESDKFLMDAFAKAVLAKQFLLGGLAWELDLDFLDRVPSLFQSIKKAIADFYPNFPIKNPEKLTNAEVETKAALLRSIARTAGRALSEFHSQNSTFSFEELMKVQMAVQNLYADPKTADDIDFREITNWAKLAEGAKGALAGPPYGFILATQWERILGLAAEGYLTYVNIMRPAPPAEQPSQQRWYDLQVHVSEALTFAENATKDHTFTLDEGYKLLELFPEPWLAKILPEGATKKDLLPLLVRLYSLKDTLISSEAIGFSTSDFQKIRLLADAFLKEWTKLSPYLPNEFEESALKEWLEQFKKWDRQKIQNLTYLLKDAGENVSRALVQIQPKILASKDIDNLLKAAKPFLKAETLKSIQEVTPLVWAAKAVLISPGADKIVDAEWPYTFKALGDWGSFGTFGMWWLSGHMPANETLFQNENLYDMNELLQGALTLLSQTALQHENSEGNPPGILFEHFDRLFDQTEAYTKAHDVSFPMSAQTLKTIIRPIVKKLLGGQRKGLSGRDALGLTAKSVESFRRHITRWYRAQTLIQKLYVNLGGNSALNSLGYDRQTLLSALSNVRLKLHDHPSAQAPRLKYEVEIVKEVRRIIEGFPPIFLGQNSYVSYPADGKTDQLYSYSNFWRVNLSWMLGRVLLESYTNEKNRASPWSGGATIDEFKEGVSDIWPLLIDLKMSNPTKDPITTAEKRFREGNLFTNSSNGNDIFEIPEWVELMGVSFSLGHSSIRIYNELVKNCQEHGIDALGLKKVRSDCARKMLFTQDGFRHFFDEAYPRVSKTYATVSRSEQFQMMVDIEIASRDVGYSLAAYESADIDSIVVIFSYLESLFKKFDANRDDVFDVDEAKAAFPVVCTLLQRASGMDGDCATGDTSSLQALFGYLLFYGKTPENVEPGDNIFDMLGKGIVWGSWRVDWWKMQDLPAVGYKMKADRARLLRIFATLSSATGGTKAKVAGGGSK